MKRLFAGLMLVLGVVGCGGGGGGGADLNTGGDMTGDAGGGDAGDPGDGAGDLACVPDCVGRSCGTDGCGGSCGDCGAGELCQEGLCVPEGGCEALEDCLPRICGEDGECTDCTGDEACQEAGYVCNEESGHCVECVGDEDCPAGEGCNESYGCEPLACPEVACPEGLVCDEEAHQCVECLSAADCGPWDECVDQACVGPTPCLSSKDCAEDEVCWKEEGICVQCVDDADCGDGFRCTAEHLCEQILYCDSDKDCKDYGKVCDKVLGECVDCLTDADCPVDGFCQAAECFPDVCDQAVEGPVCLDGDVVDCSENGSVALLLQDCPEGTFCSDAACNPWICLPGVPGCDGDLAFVCNAEGSGYAFTEDCGGGDIACVAGECLEVACQPGETVCLNEKATVTCHEDGQTFEVVECGTGFYCDAGVGACLEWVCVPYDAWCEGSVAMLCDPIGASATETQDCADDELWCVSGECVACEPDCAGLQCGDDGCGGSCGACPAGSACAWDGQCHGQVCTGACTGTSDSALFCGLDVCTPGEALGVQVTSPSSATITGAWSVMEHWGAAQNDLLVQGPPSYLALLSGLVASAEHSDDLPGNGQWDDPWSTSNGFDAVRIAYSLQAPPGASGFCVDSWFLSREFGQTQQFNDKFYILLTAAVTTGGQATPINYMPCPAPGTYTSFTGADGIAYCYVTVESGFDACQAGSAPDLSATGFTCGYGWMRTCWPLEEGEAFELAFHVHDAQDSLYDSAAVADHFTWQYGKPQQGTWFLE